MCLRPTREWPVAIVSAHTVRVYCEHGVSVEAGVKSSVSPTVLHVPATAGCSVGRGERAAGGAESVTPSVAVPLEIVRGGSRTTRVGVSGGGGAAPVALASRLPMPRWCASAAPVATPPIASTISSTLAGSARRRHAERERCPGPVAPKRSLRSEKPWPPARPRSGRALIKTQANASVSGSPPKGRQNRRTGKTPAATPVTLSVILSHARLGSHAPCGRALRIRALRTYPRPRDPRGGLLRGVGVLVGICVGIRERRRRRRDTRLRAGRLRARPRRTRQPRHRSGRPARPRAPDQGTVPECRRRFPPER